MTSESVIEHFTNPVMLILTTQPLEMSQQFETTLHRKSVIQINIKKMNLLVYTVCAFRPVNIM